MPARIPIKAARAFAKEHGLQQVILVAWDGRQTHVVTYGKTTVDCDQAAQGGDLIKSALGWPTSLNELPSRVKRMQAKIEALEATVKKLKEGETL